MLEKYKKLSKLINYANKVGSKVWCPVRHNLIIICLILIMKIILKKKYILGSSNLNESLTKNRFNKNYKNSVLIT